MPKNRVTRILISFIVVCVATGAVLFVRAYAGSSMLPFIPASGGNKPAGPVSRPIDQGTWVPGPLPSDTPTPTATSTLTPTPTVTNTPVPTNTPTPTPPPPIPVGRSGNWNLIFDDEFSGNSLDQNKWTTCFWWAQDGGCTIITNREQQWYQPQNVSVKDGKLVLSAQHEQVAGLNGVTYPFTSGMVTTGRDNHHLENPVRFSFLYGYAEIRAWLPRGKGLWPAFWLLPANNDSLPEIDVLENLGQEPTVMYSHFGYRDQSRVNRRDGTQYYGPDLSEGWHTFAVDWTPDMLVYYLDGSEIWRFDKSAYVPATPMYLLLNLAVGGTWPGSPNADTLFPAQYDIDYVRVWQRGNQTYLSPIEDASIDSSQPDRNFGHDWELHSSGSPIKVAYMKYDATALAGRKIASASIRFMTAASDGSGSQGTHFVVPVVTNDWNEYKITYNNHPNVVQESIGSFQGASSVFSFYEFPLDPSVLQSYMGSIFSLAVESNDPDGLYMFSKESGFPAPVLILHFEN